MPEFTILPILGRRSDVQQDDPSLFKSLAATVAMTHDVGGLNFDLERTKNVCSKSKGSKLWSYTTASPTESNYCAYCLGLFELYDGTNRNYIYAGGGLTRGYVFYFDSAKSATVLTDGLSTYFACDSGDYFSFIKVGAYMVFSDRGEHTPYKWKHGDANLSKLIASGTEYKFRYLVNFQRRVIGLHSDQTDGDIEVRWSTAWPSTAIVALNFPAANQLYVPNDDPITGGATMGVDRCYVYGDNSVNQLIYYPDYEAPFRMQTVVPDAGCAGHHSIINIGDRHFFFSRQYGFVEYRGGTEFPYGGVPISQAIEADVEAINTDFYHMIVGARIPFSSRIVWSLPYGGSTNNRLYYYDYLTKQWTVEDKQVMYLYPMRLNSGFIWSSPGLVSTLTNAGYATPTWANSRSYYGNSYTWAEIAGVTDEMVYGVPFSDLYYLSGDSLAWSYPASTLDGYRIEPILSFGDKYKKKLLKEIWFDIGASGDFSLHVYHRGGDTVGEVEAASWTEIGTLSCNSPDRPVIYPALSARLHQIKWGTNSNAEKFQVGQITFVYENQSRI